jgi:broad specificity phosphatase PhoE
MTHIILVRHGQTAWNREERFRGHFDIPLDETGLAQAQAVAKRVALVWKPDVIYAGPLSRTIQTAEPTARLFNLAVQSEPGLIDVDCGKWQGLTPDEARQRWPVDFNHYLHLPRAFHFPGGESLENARLRAIRRVKQLVNEHLEETIMLVSHTALNRLILLSVLALDSAGFWRLRQDTCAINSFTVENETFTLSLLNETSHLLAIAPGSPKVGISKTV